MVFSIPTPIFRNHTVSIPTVINPDLFRKVILHTISIRSNKKRKEKNKKRSGKQLFKNTYVEKKYITITVRNIPVSDL